jgi:hypothetical protein
MIPNNLDFIAYERHKSLLRDAEQRRLIKSLQLQRSDERAKFRQKLFNWIGCQMVNWGLRLQGYSITPPSHIAAARAIDVGRCQS